MNSKPAHAISDRVIAVTWSRRPDTAPAIRAVPRRTRSQAATCRVGRVVQQPQRDQDRQQSARQAATARIDPRRGRPRLPRGNQQHDPQRQHDPLPAAILRPLGAQHGHEWAKRARRRGVARQRRAERAVRVAAPRQRRLDRREARAPQRRPTPPARPASCREARRSPIAATAAIASAKRRGDPAAFRRVRRRRQASQPDRASGTRGADRPRGGSDGNDYTDRRQLLRRGKLAMWRLHHAARVTHVSTAKHCGHVPPPENSPMRSLALLAAAGDARWRRPPPTPGCSGRPTAPRSPRPTAAAVRGTSTPDYFVPRHCDSCRYDLFSPCKTAHSRLAGVQESLHPSLRAATARRTARATTSGGTTSTRNTAAARRCSCTYGPWHLDKCRKHGCKAAALRRRARRRRLRRRRLRVGGSAASWRAPAAARTTAMALLPNVEPFGGETLGTIAAHSRRQRAAPAAPRRMPACRLVKPLPPASSAAAADAGCMIAVRPDLRSVASHRATLKSRPRRRQLGSEARRVPGDFSWTAAVARDDSRGASVARGTVPCRLQACARKFPSARAAPIADTNHCQRQREGETLVAFCFRIKVAARRRIVLPRPFFAALVRRLACGDRSAARRRRRRRSPATPRRRGRGRPAPAGVRAGAGAAGAVVPEARLRNRRRRCPAAP